MPRRGYKQSPEHVDRRRAAISAAMTSRRHSEQTKQLIGEGVRRAAEARNWHRRPPNKLDFMVSLAISYLTRLFLEGRESPIGWYPNREDFERLPKPERSRIVRKLITRADWEGRAHGMIVEFVDGSRWPAPPSARTPRVVPPKSAPADLDS